MAETGKPDRKIEEDIEQALEIKNQKGHRVDGTWIPGIAIDESTKAEEWYRRQKEYRQKYNTSETGRSAQRRYNESPKGKDSHKRYAQSEAGKQAQKEYRKRRAERIKEALKLLAEQKKLQALQETQQEGEQNENGNQVQAGQGD